MKLDAKLGNKISGIVIIIAAAAVLIWDIAALFIFKGELTASVSWKLWEFSRAAPIIPFASGVLCGHVFWGDPNTSLMWVAKKKP